MTSNVSKHSQEYMQNRFDYDQNTGILTYRKPPLGRVKGQICGWVDKNGYRSIEIDGKAVQATHVIWMYVFGVSPGENIDHIDGNPGNNSLSNLRDVSRRENQWNRKQHRKGKLTGSTYHKKARKFMSQIRVNKKYIYLGLYDTELEAHLAYVKYFKQNNIV
jgi:hypothetical protein